MWRSTKLRLSPFCLPALGAALLCGAGEVLPLVLLAALCHELGHLFVLQLFHVPVEEVVLSPMGAVISAPGQEKLSYGAELAAVLAGPAVNLALAIVFARVCGDYLFAGANAILGVYNLLPVQGLDGGRALYLVLAWCTEPFTALRIAGTVNLIAMALLLGLSAVVFYHTGGGVFALLAAGGMAVSQALRWFGGRGAPPSGASRLSPVEKSSQAHTEGGRAAGP